MIFGFLPQNLKTGAVAVAFIMSWHDGEGEERPDEALGQLRVPAVERNLNVRGRADRCGLRDFCVSEAEQAQGP